MSDERLTFKEMCARFDVTPRTLRYYEYIELLFPEKDGRSRFYHSREIARMTLILRGRRSLAKERSQLDETIDDLTKVRDGVTKELNKA